ncbi:MAG: ABC transporter permease [Agromyces sp.]
MSSNGTEREPVIVEPAPTTAVAASGRRLADSKPEGFGARMKYELQFIRGRGAFEISIVFLAIIVIFSAISAANPAGFPFLSPNNLSGVLTQSVPLLAILSIAVGILMVAGEFDLSLGFAITFNAIVFVRFAEVAGPVAGIVGALLSGMFIAAVNASIVVFTKIPSFIATLGMGFFWGGASIFINGTNSAQLPVSLQDKNSWFNFTFAHDFGSFRSQVVWLLIVGVIAWFFVHRHKYGNHIFAVGGNANAARAISIKPGAVKIYSWLIYGLLSGLASILFIARIPSVQPGGNATADFTLFAIAAAVVGGTSLLGGRGSVIGMVVGAALIEVIKNGLILAKAPGFYLQLFVGVTIVIAAIFNRFMEGKAS